MFQKANFVGPRQWIGNLAGHLFWRFKLLLSLQPWIVLLGVNAPELFPEAPFSQAHFLSHWILCCSLVALLALVLCEGSVSTCEEGNSPWQEKPGWVWGEEPWIKVWKRAWNFLGLGRREIGVKFFGAADHGPKLFAQMSRHVSRESPRLHHQFAQNFAPDFVPVLAQPTEFALRSLSAFEAPRSRRTSEAQRLVGTPRPLSWRATNRRPTTIKFVIKMKDRGWGTKALRTRLFSLRASAWGCSTNNIPPKACHFCKARINNVTTKALVSLWLGGKWRGAPSCSWVVSQLLANS